MGSLDLHHLKCLNQKVLEPLFDFISGIESSDRFIPLINLKVFSDSTLIRLLKRYSLRTNLLPYSHQMTLCQLYQA
jgi:hypothetical protein